MFEYAETYARTEEPVKGRSDARLVRSWHGHPIHPLLYSTSLMGELPEQAGKGIERAPMLDQAHLLLELSRAVTSSLDLQQVLDTSFHALRRLVSFGGGSIQLIDDGALVPVATEPPMTDEAKRVRIPVGKGISGTIAATAEAIYIPDILSDPRVPPPTARKGVSRGVRSYFGVPLIMHGEPVGVLQIDSAELDAFPPDARACVLMLVPAIAAAVQNALLFDRERAALQQLQETEQQQRDFVAIVSHELRICSISRRSSAARCPRNRLRPTSSPSSARACASSRTTLIRSWWTFKRPCRRRWSTATGSIRSWATCSATRGSSRRPVPRSRLSCARRETRSRSRSKITGKASLKI
ncbi:MAG: GAF domain-containing protein [Actinobacteria bacterium]|nr:MAG: GAF domain-containing protein [Actinomycetota bacterium]